MHCSEIKDLFIQEGYIRGVAKNPKHAQRFVAEIAKEMMKESPSLCASSLAVIEPR